ncbi:MAG: hypothetical protein Ct9H300mP26_2110 [Acidimicrobiales bacterium]|nr:MAG: hypothetical protein Ct9H300mP26_2110 [Acidimicrobiales bacterium]
MFRRPPLRHGSNPTGSGRCQCTFIHHEFAQGYDTVIGERGIRLSGGQRQRIAIARALLKDAPILVLDEALSSVDAENEALIQEALDRLMVGRTTLIFAHRLSSVIGADRILVLETGDVVESGTHSQLMERGQRYYALMAGQLSEENVTRPTPKNTQITDDNRIFDREIVEPRTTKSSQLLALVGLAREMAFL